ncbi:serine hydrolase domain-containing protein [Spirosoma jeollabukense]
MKKLLLLVLTLFFRQVWAQPVKPINSIKELVDSITTIVQQKKIPGLLLGITTRDSVLFSGGLGYADLAAGRPVSNRTLFRMGSITKSIVSLAILKLAEEGKINLNDELRKIAPEVPFVNPWEQTNPVRVINLLEHTTGFDDFKFNHMYALERKDYGAKEMMLLQKESMRCRWKPSERFSYNNVNYAILGYLISKITGTRYDQYLIRNVMQPLGMTHSNFNLYSKYPLREAKEYSPSDGKLQAVPSVSFLIGPAGALWSDAEDMVKLVQFFLGDGQPVIRPSSLKKMETPQSSLAARAGVLTGYSAGNEDFDGFRGHRGILGTYRSSYRYNRKLGIGFVVCSSGNGLATVENLITDYLVQTKSPIKAKTTRMDTKAMTPYLGYYQIENPRFELLGFLDRLLLVNVEEAKDTLWFSIFGKKIRALPTGSLTFTNRSSNASNIVFLQSYGKKILVVNDYYCEKVSGVWALTSRFILFLSCLVAVFGIIPAIISLVQRIRRKYTGQLWLLMSLPTIAVICLLAAILNFEAIYTDSYRLYTLATVNMTSVIIFAGTLLFGLLSAGNLIYLVMRFKAIQTRLMGLYLLITAASLLIITAFLLTNGWIGLRTWAM